MNFCEKLLRRFIETASGSDDCCREVKWDTRDVKNINITVFQCNFYSPEELPVYETFLKDWQKMKAIYFLEHYHLPSDTLFTLFLHSRGKIQNREIFFFHILYQFLKIYLQCHGKLSGYAREYRFLETSSVKISLLSPF